MSESSSHAVASVVPSMNQDRTLAWDWHRGRVPENVCMEPGAYLETTYSFHLFRSQVPEAVRIERGASIYLGSMFDLGGQARLHIGAYTLMNGARIICDAEVRIGSHCLISWNVVLMDTYRVPLDPELRRRELAAVAARHPRHWSGTFEARPIHIGSNVWIGFDVCVLPGVSIGEGSVVGARSVVRHDVPPFTIVAGNPARVIRSLQPGGISAASIPHGQDATTLP